jgi:hypothetical protein
MEAFLKSIADDINLCGNDEDAFPLKLIREYADEVIDIDRNHWLILKHHENDVTLEFGLFEFSYAQNEEDDDERVSKVFLGSGTKGSLREMRHIWWGAEGDGYTFYLDGSAVIKTFEYLRKYFDY